MSRANETINAIDALRRPEIKLAGELPDAAKRDDIKATKGEGYATDNKASSSQGVAFPLTENGSNRIYYPDRYLYSTDGMFSIAWAPVKKANFTDNSGSSGDVNYADPDA